MVVFKKRDSVPRAKYSSVCNVLRQWRIWLNPTYRVYRLYDIAKIGSLNRLRDRFAWNNSNSNGKFARYVKMPNLSISVPNLSIYIVSRPTVVS